MFIYRDPCRIDTGEMAPAPRITEPTYKDTDYSTEIRDKDGYIEPSILTA
ncbi:MAG: hypothetical protein MPK62_02025 [Alphaproteobacteria bacterium]|nr:hypothetical protein [Alphaproteobacteria bacterium]